MTDRTQTPTQSRLSSPWLALARLGWLAFFAFATLALLFAIPARWAQLTQPTPTTLANLSALGWPVMGYAAYSLATEVIFTAVFLVVGLLIFARRSNDGMALFMSLTLVAYGVGNQTITPTISVLLAYPWGKFIYPCLTFAAWATFTQFPYLFPNGRYVPRWARLLGLIWFLLCILWNFLPSDSPWGVFNWPPIIFVPLLLFMWGSWVVSQVYRYARVSTPVERQQTKWVVYALVMIVVSIMLGTIGITSFGSFETMKYLSAGEPPTPQAFFSITAFQALARLSVILLPIAFAFSIFRYRLFEIDLIIKRTVQYALISGAGFIIYLLAVGGTSLFLQSNIELVAGMIAIALVVIFFNPARKRLQAALDKVMPYTPPPPEALAELEREKAEREKLARPSRTGVPPVLAARTVSGAEGNTLKQEAHRQSTADDTRLRGPWLNVARALWVLMSAAALLAFIASQIIAWGEPLPSCATPDTFCGPWQVSQEDVAVAQQLGLPDQFMRLAYFAPLILARVSFVVVGLLIFWRKSDDWVALLLSLMLMLWLVEGVQNLGVWMPAVNVLYTIDTAVFYVLPFIFPTGRFVPRWTRWFVVLTILLTLPLMFLPTLGIRVDDSLFGLALVAAFVPWMFVAGYAVLHRYRRISNATERQQTKWVMTGILSTFITAIPFLVIAIAFPPSQPSPARLAFVTLVLLPISTLTYFAVSGGVAFAILRYRLYDIDIIIRRTTMYGGIMAGLALAYFGGVALLQWLSQALTGPQSNFVVVLITLGIVALFNPVRRRFQILIDRAFYREKVDFRQAFTAFAREIRAIIDLRELLRTLVNRTTDLLHITHGAVYLSPDGTEEADSTERTFRAAEGRNLPEGTDSLTLGTEMLERLQGGHAVSRPGHKLFPLLVPLIAPVQSAKRGPHTAGLIGVLALGPRLSEQAYSQEDQTLLTGLADQAGTAVYVAQLIGERQAEAARIEEAERRLETYRNSPAGRAEAFASALIADPQHALSELHTLAQNAGPDPALAAMLEPLPAALSAAGAPQMAGVADGYRYLFAGQSAPELLPVGLRTLTEALASLNADEARELYLLCQRALDANSIPQITALLDDLPGGRGAEEARSGAPVAALAQGLGELRPAAEGLRAYERVDSPQDKLAYLASAVERLSHADRLARAELGAADRGLVQRIAGNWLAVVTGAMSELQTRARLVCRLLTRHTWTGEVVSLALGLRNEGRGAALNIKVSLAPAPEYTVLDEVAPVERLAAGEEAQVELRVRPRLSEGTGAGQFRARFVVLYDDPRGPDQAENFADVVYLLAGEGEFQFIPNPYVVGTPLQTGSSLFFGRDDVFGFIQENLAAAHQNNLVLIGQRRTGKTSLLKQLPARLGDRYVPIYLDGQSLALDPGLPNFFYSLATEIAFALEDRGLSVGELPEFADSPAATFERKFLTQVRSAIGDRHLLLLLDEFEELEGAVRRGNLDSSVFGFLRHLIQHSDNLSVIFCGTHRMEELAADYWSVLFNISLYRHVAFLQQAEAAKLIQEPVGAYGMKYDDLALDKMWRVTAGHPYFLQLLCHSLVNQHNKSQRNYVTVADVNAALDEILASGEAHFVYLWTESTQAERLALTALSRMMPLTGQANAVQVRDYLEERGVPLDRRAVSEALHHLVLRDILRFNRNEGDSIVADADAYRWQLGLLGLWVEKYKSLSRVVDELK
jgi:hypothetical protein